MTFNPRDLPVRTMRGGAQYMDVKYRLVWLREDAPDSRIETEMVSITPEIAVFRAAVTRIVNGEVRGIATGYGSETPGDFRDYVEKAETKAIGRALAGLGYGTQFLDDDGQGLVDSPAPVRAAAAAAPAAVPSHLAPHADVIARAVYGAGRFADLRDRDRAEMVKWSAEYNEAGMAVVAEYAQAIADAADEATLVQIGTALKGSGVDDGMLRTAWKRRKTAVDAAAGGAGRK